MNKKLQKYAEQVNGLSLRERLMVMASLAVLLIFLWWNFFAQQVIAETKAVSKSSKILEAEIQTLDLTVASIQKRMNDGVFKSKKQKLKALEIELIRVRELLDEKTRALIKPDEMFELMQQLLPAESRLKLTAMKRKAVNPVVAEENDDSYESAVYQHVLQLSFEGRYKNIINYIRTLEELDWKLTWDRINLETTEYPIIGVTIEISTFSDNKNWVGL